MDRLDPMTRARRDAGTLTAGDESAIRAWLVLIEETDPVCIAKVFEQCRTNADARAWFRTAR